MLCFQFTLHMLFFLTVVWPVRMLSVGRSGTFYWIYSANKNDRKFYKFFFFRLLNLFIFRCIICIKWTRVRSRAVLQMCELAIARSALAHAHRHIETKLNTNDEEIWYAQTSWRIIWNAWCVRRSQSIANKIVTLIEQYGNHLIQL